jgi:hypothetical protein
VNVTLKDKAPLIVPPSVRQRAGRDGDDEHTPAQRRAILADAKAGLKEIEQGRGYGPFETGAKRKVKQS